MIRMAYYEHPDYVPLLRRAYELWYELEEHSGQKLLYETGGIYMGRAGGEVVGGALQAARRHGIEHELLDGAQLSERYPQFKLPGDFVGLQEKRAGFLLPERVVAVQADRALRAGAELHGHERVIEWDEGRVRTERGEYRAKQLVFCGGPWSGKLLRDLGIELIVSRQIMGWVWPKAPEQFALGRFGVWGIENKDGSLSYGFPMIPGGAGMKLARHARGPATDPDAIDRSVRPADLEEIQQILRSHIPLADGPILSIRTCMYTNSPDSHFIIDRHPSHSNVLIACGFSGHGFKFASVVGEALADLATRGKTALPIGFLGLDRFNS
jgi:sarcosine oxidase